MLPWRTLTRPDHTPCIPDRPPRDDAAMGVEMSRFMMQALGWIRPLSLDGGSAAIPLLVSADHGWRGVPFEVHRSGPFVGERDSGPPSGHITLIVCVEGTTQVVFREKGREVAYQSAPGTLSVH